MKPTTENGRPREENTTPAAPFTSAGLASPAPDLAKLSRLLGHRRRSANQPGSSRERGATIGSQNDVWVEERDQGTEVALAGGGEVGVDDLALAAEVGVGESGCSLHPAACTARELPRRGWGALNDRRDLVEGHGEHVMQDEREPLGGSQSVEYHEQGEPDRVGEQRLMLGVGSVLGADDRVGHVRAERLLGPRFARLQGRQAHPGDDRGQPPAQVLDAVAVGSADSQPGFLNRVVRLAQRAEHPIGDRSQVRALLLETLRQQLVLDHRSHSLVA